MTNAARPDDMDTVLAQTFGEFDFEGTTYRVLPISTKTQRYARELHKEIASGVEMTPGEFAAKIAVRCMKPEPSAEQLDEMPVVLLEWVARQATQGIEAMERIIASLRGGQEKNGEAPDPAPAPPSP